MYSVLQNTFGMKYSAIYCMFFKPDNEKRCVSVLKCMYILYSQILLIKQLIYEYGFNICDYAI